jgi:transposase
MSFVRGESRSQSTLFPVTLDELIPEDHLVRVIDLWVDRIELDRLGFDKAQPKGTGRPPYDPADLLKLYLYGYLNQVRSSRKLEREAHRNVELMWLLGRLQPDFKTIANFRRENGTAFAATCRAFVTFCRGERLVGGELVAIDGSKFGAVASKRGVISRSQLEIRVRELDADIAKYLVELEMADAREEAEEAPNAKQLRQTIERLKKESEDAAVAVALMNENAVQHYVQGEPEARVMKTGAGRSVTGYNVQSAVDARHGLIVHHEVTQDINDNRQLQPMATATKAVLEQEQLVVVADAGYTSGEQLAECDRAKITAYVPPRRGVNNQGEGDFFAKEQFIYDSESDSFRCPAGKQLLRKHVMAGRQQVLYGAKAKDCSGCPLKAQCTDARRRLVTRHVHEETLAAAAARCKANPEMMKQRRALAEHPFGTLKERILGNARFLMRGLRGARTEMALAVLAYNFKRVANIKGVVGMAGALLAN